MLASAQLFLALYSPPRLRPAAQAKGKNSPSTPDRPRDTSRITIINDLLITVTAFRIDNYLAALRIIRLKRAALGYIQIGAAEGLEFRQALVGVPRCAGAVGGVVDGEAAVGGGGEEGEERKEEDGEEVHFDIGIDSRWCRWALGLMEWCCGLGLQERYILYVIPEARSEEQRTRPVRKEMSGSFKYALPRCPEYYFGNRRRAFPQAMTADRTEIAEDEKTGRMANAKDETNWQNSKYQRRGKLVKERYNGIPHVMDSSRISLDQQKCT